MAKKVLLAVAAVWSAGWIAAGIVAGFLAWRHIPYPVYFFIPLSIAALAGTVPGSLLALLACAKLWRTRLAVASAYILAAGALFGGVSAWRGHYEVPRDGGPYLAWTGDPKTTATACWSSDEKTAGLVEYTTDGWNEWLKAECPPTHYPKATMAGLQPGTRYRYRIPALGKTEYTFQTAPGSAEDFSVAVYGDNRHAGGLSFHRSVVRALLREEPVHGGFRFVINSGDIVERPGRGHGWQWHTFLRDITPIASTRFYEVSLGNHEAGGGTERYEEYFDYGTPVHWRSVDYAGVRFISLSTQDDLGANSEQVAWLKNCLDSRPPDIRFTAVTLHKPLDTYDPRERYRDSETRQVLEPLFKAKGVDIVFAGHVHAYEHLRMDGFDQVITGGGGVMLWNKPVPGPETAKTETCWHFCAVDVRGDTMKVTAIRTDGSVIESFEIKSKKP